MVSGSDLRNICYSPSWGDDGGLVSKLQQRTTRIPPPLSLKTHIFTPLICLLPFTFVTLYVPLYSFPTHPQPDALFSLLIPPIPSPLLCSALSVVAYSLRSYPSLSLPSPSSQQFPYPPLFPYSEQAPFLSPLSSYLEQGSFLFPFLTLFLYFSEHFPFTSLPSPLPLPKTGTLFSPLFLSALPLISTWVLLFLPLSSLFT